MGKISEAFANFITDDSHRAIASIAAQNAHWAVGGAAVPGGMGLSGLLAMDTTDKAGKKLVEFKLMNDLEKAWDIALGYEYLKDEEAYKKIRAKNWNIVHGIGPQTNSMRDRYKLKPSDLKRPNTR
ncbi:MAG: hypothetical protein LBL52_02355 [Rickettsiales bacterium]|jgi:hypothetical protein|nr:hypothetical protein [Rickettsiales bacterium]